MFGSLRQAIGYMVAWESGPQMSRPRYTDEPRVSPKWTGEKAMAMASLVARFIYSDMGVVRGGATDRALRRYATEKGRSLDGRALEVARALDRMLSQNDLKPPRPNIKRVTRQPAGCEEWHLVEWVEMPANRVIKRGWERIQKGT